MIKHFSVAARLTIVTVILLGFIYPLVMTGMAQVLFNQQANGSLVTRNGTVIGSSIIGQQWSKPQYFHGRPSAAGKGYDPTQTGGTNLGPSSKKLIDATKAAIASLKKENPAARAPVPMDLVTSSGSGIDPDITPEAAYFQVPRVAQARHLAIDRVDALVKSQIEGRTFGVLGEPRVNVFELNLALDALAR